MSRAPLAARLLRRWHKRFGLLAAVFFMFLAVSGLALNHGEAFELDSSEIAAPWLMAWYGLKPTVPERGFLQEDLTFCWQGEVWALAGRRIKAGHGEPVGAARTDGQIWIATADEIRLYDTEGRQVDKIERDLLPGAPIRRIGTRHGQLVVNVGNASYVTADGLNWQRLPSDAVVDWTRLSPLSAAQQRDLAALFAPSLPLQRIVADLHSGRFFGPYGPLVTDALALILIVLAGSGLWLYATNRPRRNKPSAAPAREARPADEPL